MWLHSPVLTSSVWMASSSGMRILEQGLRDRGLRQDQGDGRRGGEPPAGQASPEPVSATAQATPDGADRPPELLGGLVVGEPFEIAKHQGRPVFLGEPGEFVVEDLADLGVFEEVGRLGGEFVEAGPFERLPAAG